MTAPDGTHSNYAIDRIGGIMVSVLAASAVDRGFWSRSNQTNEIYICCSSSKHAVLKREREREQRPVCWEQDNVSEC